MNITTNHITQSELEQLVASAWRVKTMGREYLFVHDSYNVGRLLRWDKKQPAYQVMKSWGKK